MTADEIYERAGLADVMADYAAMSSSVDVEVVNSVAVTSYDAGWSDALEWMNTYLRETIDDKAAQSAVETAEAEPGQTQPE